MLNSHTELACYACCIFHVAHYLKPNPRVSNITLMPDLGSIKVSARCNEQQMIYALAYNRLPRCALYRNFLQDV